jgi:hypothetical protein
MAFNITSWGRRGRNYGRGEPPPRGSIEWIAVGDMWEPDPSAYSTIGNVPPPKNVAASYTDVDAADRWMKTVDRSVSYARQIHGDKILSKGDAEEWSALMSKWTAFRNSNSALTPENRKQFDDVLNTSKRLHDKFTGKGMGIIPVPYASELVALIRETPKRLTSAQMADKLDTGIKCGEKILDNAFPWYHWMLPHADTKPMRTSLVEAGNAARIFRRSAGSMAAYAPGDPVYDEFLRRLTRIWIEAAGLYGIQETRQAAVAEAKDTAVNQAVSLEKSVNSSRHLLWLLGLTGAAYLGLHWLVGGGSQKTVVIAVPTEDLEEDEDLYE